MAYSDVLSWLPFDSNVGGTIFFISSDLLEGYHRGCIGGQGVRRLATGCSPASGLYHKTCTSALINVREAVQIFNIVAAASFVAVFSGWESAKSSREYWLKMAG